MILKDFLKEYVDKFQDIQIFNAKTSQALTCRSYLEGGSPAFKSDIESYGLYKVFGVGPMKDAEGEVFLAITVLSD